MYEWKYEFMFNVRLPNKPTQLYAATSSPNPKNSHFIPQHQPNCHKHIVGIAFGNPHIHGAWHIIIAYSLIKYVAPFCRKYVPTPAVGTNRCVQQTKC